MYRLELDLGIKINFEICEPSSCLVVVVNVDSALGDSKQRK